VTYTTGKNGLAFNFSSGSYVEAPDAANLDINNHITIAAWIKANSLGGRIVDKITAGGNDGYMLDTNGGKIRLIACGSVSSTSNVPLNSWVHVAGVYDGSKGYVYINGVLSGSANISGSIPTNNMSLIIGSAHNEDIFFDGLIDDVLIYNRSLTASEIQSLASGNNPSSTFTDPGADTWTANVNYGDGSGVQPLVLTGKTFSLSHVYADMARIP